MSGTTNISVAASGQIGGFVLPSDFAGSPTVPGNINSSIASLIASYISSASGGTQFFENRDIVTTPASDYLTNGTDGTGLQVFSNTNNDGTVATGSVPGSASLISVNNAASLVVVQAPGNTTVAGSSSTTGSFFGANSNVNYTVVNPDAGSIFAAGGADSITLEQFGSNRLNESVASAGNDTVYAQGQGSVNVSAVGNASDYVTIGAANVTVSASDNAQAIIGFDGPNAGGSLYFINNSTAQQSIFAAVFGSGDTALTAAVNVTAFGGIGGGYFIGGQKSGGTGANLLVGGAPGSFSINASTGAVYQAPDGNAGFTTLLGGSGGTVMDVQSHLGADVFLGTGSETVIAASTSGSNLFQIGLNYPGLGFVPSEGLVSSDGSGTQSFFVGNSVGATLVGSTAVGSNNNIFYITSDTVNGQTIGGGNFKIENFADNGFLYLTNATETAPSSVSITVDGPEQGAPQNTQITLSDGTSITLLNTNAANVHSIVGGNNITTFYYS